MTRVSRRTSDLPPEENRANAAGKVVVMREGLTIMVVVVGSASQVNLEKKLYLFKKKNVYILEMYIVYSYMYI